MHLSRKKTAHLAGIYYLVLVISSFYGVMYVPSKIMVKGDAATTMNNLLAHEFLFRTGIFSQLFSSVTFIFLALTLYRLLKTVNESQAKLMVAFVLVQIPVVFLGEAFNVSAMMVAKGEIMQSLDVSQRQEMTILFLKTYDYGIMLLETFWGLWLIPFGVLCYQSSFIPRLLGILLILGGVAYIVEVFAFLLFPETKATISKGTIIFYSIAEIGTVLWLLIKGVNEK
jgi:hypothetical protein